MPSASGLCDNREERERGREVRVSFGLGLERVGALGAPRGEHGASTHFSNRFRCVRLALAPRLSVCPLVRCDISRTLSKRLPRGSSGRFLPLSLSLCRARALTCGRKKATTLGPLRRPPGLVTLECRPRALPRRPSRFWRPARVARKRRRFCVSRASLEKSKSAGGSEGEPGASSRLGGCVKNAW